MRSTTTTATGSRTRRQAAATLILALTTLVGLLAATDPAGAVSWRRVVTTTTKKATTTQKATTTAKPKSTTTTKSKFTTVTAKPKSTTTTAKPTTTTTAKPTTTTTAKPTTTTTAAPTTTTTAPTTTTTAQSGPDCGGTRTVARPDGLGTWTCTFDEEFDGTQLDLTKWKPMTTYGSNLSSGGQDCLINDPDNISIGGGELTLTTRLEDAPFRCDVVPGFSYQTQRSSGMVTTHGGLFQQAYGRWEIRARITNNSQPGTQSALWLWPVDDTKYGPRPASGEIDIAEFYGQYPDLAVPYVHYNNTTDKGVTNTRCRVVDPTQFHDYTLEWTPESIKVSYDGVTCIDDHWSPLSPQTGRQPFDQPFFLNLTQGLGQLTNAPMATTPTSASTIIDYVRVYG
jgi:hypothetical protein